MKQIAFAPGKNSRENPGACPVNCPVCRYDGDVYPARFHRAELERETDLGGMERKANHIVFLLGGTLHIRTQENEHHYLNSGQCIFLPRAQRPDIRAIAPSRVVWLDFSNRLVLGGQDALASTVLSGGRPAEGYTYPSCGPADRTPADGSSDPGDALLPYVEAIRAVLPDEGFLLRRRASPTSSTPSCVRHTTSGHSWKAITRTPIRSRT